MKKTVRVEESLSTLDWFTGEMRKKLAQNRHKGSVFGVRQSELYDFLFKEQEELMFALMDGNSDEIVQECADVANFAMFIAIRATDRR